jgi:two-component sensor histidine kinase/tetratricopeptide (TPR) repeat protein
MPFTDERKSKIELAFYSELIPDLYMSGLVPQLYLSAVQSTQHCLEGGMDESVIYSFSIMGLYLGEKEFFEQAFRYEDLAKNLSEKYPNTFGATRGMNGVVWCNMHSRNTPAEIVNYCLKSIQSGRNCGDLYNAGLSYGPLMWNLQVQGRNFLDLETYARECLHFSQKYQLSFSVGLAQAVQAGWVGLMKKDYVPLPMEENLKRWQEANHIASAGSYFVHLAIVSYYFHEFETAEKHLQEVNRYLSGLTDNVLKRQWYVFRALNALQLHRRGTGYKTRKELLDYIEPIQVKIETWAKLGPLLRPYLELLRAERERCLGSPREARNLYLDAVSIARDADYTFLEGYIHETLGELLAHQGQKIGSLYLQEALRLYRKCHAERKELTLLEAHPEIDVEPRPPHPIEPELPGGGEQIPDLDIQYLMKSALAISAEINTDALQKKIMNTVLEASGAQHGYLIVEEDGDLQVRAESHVTEKDLIQTEQSPLRHSSQICQAIVRFVHRTGQSILLNNACEDPTFKENSEVQALQLKSVYCIPLLEQSRMMGILYLENRLSDSVFTESRAEMTRLLASQAAISLENARLIENMKIAENRIKASLREKEILLKEVHHRVKNNLQVISSLFNLQSMHLSQNIQRDKKDTRDLQILDMIRDSQNRIRSMAFVHEKLHQSSDLSKIDLAGYVRVLTANLFRSYGINQNRIRLKIDIENTPMIIETAIPLGLIINEIVSNSLKHAFPAERAGTIRVGLDVVSDSEYHLNIEDDGIGFPPGFDFSNTNTLGMQLINTLTEQLGGSIAIDGGHGTRFHIRWPIPRMTTAPEKNHSVLHPGKLHQRTLR